MAKLVCIKDNYCEVNDNGITGNVFKNEIHNGHFSYEYDNWYLYDRKYPEILFYPKDCFMLLSEYRETRLNEILND